ncbi:MAG TPA: BTAD domain-containing putative transcriptional regulator, partial [Acidimicrobiia bacterium]|nr:BTAD domain-containing putative transcriptional regulator [Acidimicrobiia bacterium]
MRFRVLGPLEALDTAGDPVALTGIKERTLLAALLVNPGDVVSTDRLIDIVWPERPPANPANALQARVSALRRSLSDPGVIATQPPGYRIGVSPEEVDATRFESLLDEARRSSTPSTAVEVYDRALGLWRGDPFADFAYQDFARAEILRLEELLAMAKEERIQLLLDLGRHGEALAELESLVIEHPFRERLRGQLMLALYRSGRQADALRAFADAARALGDELGIEPSAELRDLEEAILVQDPSVAGPAQIAQQRLHNLPARLTSLVGRSQDVSRVVDLLSEHRLLTITGPGGVGKTSLAVACGQELMGRFEDGIWFVELAAITDPALVPVEIARSLSLDIGDRPTPELICEVFADRRMVLVMDTCEHLIDAVAATIATLLRKAPELRVIATSREPLGVPGEILWPTRPLAIPTDEGTAEDAASYDSVRLFVERARAVYPDFELDAETTPDVVAICRHLDGLPLALELAAARVHSLAVNEIASRLDDRFRLLTTGPRTVLPRQLTLEATISWSYDLLTEEERALFRRISVFSGGWTEEAAGAVSSRHGGVFDLLSRLVDRSLLTIDRSSAVSRFSMLETVREFAARELATSGDQDETVQLHAEWFLDLAESAVFQGPDQARWEQALSAEYENLRVALLRTLETGDPATALRLGGALGWWWFFGNRDEGRALLDQLLDGTSDADLPERVPVLLARARLDLFGPTARSLSAAHEALVLADRHGDAGGVAKAAIYLALDPTTERSTMLDEAIDFFATAGEPWDEALARFQRMERLARDGDPNAAIEEGETALRLFRTTGDPWAISAALAHL